MLRGFESIFLLLMPTFSSDKDEYGKDVVSPNGLSFGRVLEGRHIVSESHLLSLPFDMLDAIAQYLPNDDLGKLALVNSDCRQWARAQQFKSILLNYGVNSFNILAMLYKEHTERNKSPSPGTYIGPCIRRLTVATNPGWLEHIHGLSDLQKMDAETAKGRHAEAAKTYYDSYLKTLEAALLLNWMPNLELLNWEDKVLLSKSLLTAMAGSSIRHLRLFRVRFDEEFEIQLPAPNQRSWPLQSLHLEPSWASEGKDNGDLRPMTESIFRLCAPTIETLKWIGNIDSRQKYSFMSSKGSVQFPSLRRLTMEFIEFSDSSVLEVFLGPETKVRQLETNIREESTSIDFFNNH